MDDNFTSPFKKKRTVFFRLLKSCPSVRNVSLFKMLMLGVLFLLLALPGVLYAQQRVVTGKVVDETGIPVYGATVYVDGTTIGTTTNENGAFTITITGARSVLKVSYIGYIAETVTSLNNPHIVLRKDAMNLEEVVVVGYGTQRMKNVTGSIATVKPEEIKDLPMMNLGASIRGTVPGLNISGGENRPGSAATITLRYGESPIYVIDDLVYSQNKADGAAAFNNLDPNMIESITILKDGAAAIYGAASGMGAILVKTKRGHVGPVKVTYNGSVSVADEIKRPKMMDAYNYGILKNRIVASNWVADRDIANRQTGLFQADELEAMKKMNYDWLDNAWSAAYDMKHNVNISGGTERGTFYAGISYGTRNGNLGVEKYERWNVRAGVDTKLANNLKASLSIGGDWAKNEQTWSKIGGENMENDYNFLLQTPRHIPWELYDESGNRHYLARTNFSNATPGENTNELYNWYAMQDLDNRKASRPVNMTVNGSLAYDFNWSQILKGLTLKLRYSQSFGSELDNRLGTYVDLMGFKQRGGSGGHLWIDGGPFLADANGHLMDANNLKPLRGKNDNCLVRILWNKEQYQLNFDVNYVRSFGLHNISAVFSIERMEMETRKQQLKKENPIPNYTGEFNGALGDPDIVSERTEGGALGYVGRLDYDYNSRYILSFLFRSDASTKFAPENYWGSFYSISAGWIISEESWFKESVSWVDFLKLRASWALTGTDNTNAWGWMQRFSYHHDKGPVLGGDNYRKFAMNLESAPNRDGHWDKKYKHSLGIDAHFLSQRLSLTVDGYFDRLRDGLATRSGATVPITIGANLVAENFKATDYFGFDFSIGWKDKIGLVGYRINLNASWQDARGRIDNWPAIPSFSSAVPDGPTDTGTWGMDAIGILRSEEDIDKYFAEHNITKYFGNDVTTQAGRDKIFPGMIAYRDIRGVQNTDGTYEVPDGIIDKDLDKIKLAERTRLGGFSMNLGLDWKDFSFTAQLSSSWGGYPQMTTRPGTGDLTNVPAFWGDMFHWADIVDEEGNVVAPANVDGKWPNPTLTGTTETSSIWHVPSFRLYLRNASLGYTVPKSVVEKINFSSLRLTLTGTNLINFVNPYPDKFYNMLQGYSGYPTTRVVSLGVNIGF